MDARFTTGAITIGVESEQQFAVPAVLERFRGDAEPLASCRCVYGAVAQEPRRPVLFESQGVWRLDQTQRGVRLVLRQGEHPGRPYHALDVDADLTRGTITIDPQGLRLRRLHAHRKVRLRRLHAPFPLGEPLHQLWVSFLLMRGRGLLMHGFGALVDGRAHLFLGESGAGKTTLAGLFAARGTGEILSDDRVIVRPTPSGPVAYGTPWHGTGGYASPNGGPLAAIYFLRKDTVSAAHSIGRAQAAARMFATCFVAGWPRRGLDFVLDTCAQVAAQVPCRELRFGKDDSALAAVGLL